MNYYADLDIEETKAAGELMGFDLISVCENNFGYVENETLALAFLNELFGMYDSDPLKIVGIPNLVRDVYRKLQLMEAKDVCWGES
jgi:hypothetical protein